MLSSEEEWKSLSFAMKNMTHTKNFDHFKLQSMNLTDKGLLYMLPVFENGIGVIELILHNNRISDQGLQHLIPVLMKLPLFSHLEIHNNYITDEGVKYLQDSLRNWTSLKTMYLWGNNITDNGSLGFRVAWNNAGKNVQDQLGSGLYLSCPWWRGGDCG